MALPMKGTAIIKHWMSPGSVVQSMAHKTYLPDVNFLTHQLIHKLLKASGLTLGLDKNLQNLLSLCLWKPEPGTSLTISLIIPLWDLTIPKTPRDKFVS